ncbi:MAG TPA: LysM domain-containing protein, partial [Anaerolineales bacterium]|nr:LysM domain-containing protein [Anaerolineales bacterium]
MNVKHLLFISLIIVSLLVLGIGLPLRGANAAPEAQFVTATPGPDGRILYTVVAGDSCLQVALLHGITVQQLRQFNNRLDADCTLAVGQQLVVGLASANEPTAGPAPTLPSPTVTATPV